MAKSILIIPLLLLSHLSFASSQIEIEIADLDQSLERILLNSNILDAFLYGDNGIECGEPSVALESINEDNQKLSIEVIPAAQEASCEINSYHCHLDYELNESGQIMLLNDTSLLPIFNDCHQ